MKYLENRKLTELSSELSDAVLGDSQRIIQGRIEVYSMKRAGTDKKYAYELGQRYKEEIEDLQEEMAATAERKTNQRKRSNSSPSDLEVAGGVSPKQAKVPGQLSVRNRSISVPEIAAEEEKKQQGDADAAAARGGRRRAQSFDFTLDTISPKTTLGDFSEHSTRRLMTDLVLTLNASFPDYDFSNVKPSQFQKMKTAHVQKRIFENLSELAAQKESTSWLVELWSALDEVIGIRDCDVYSFEGFEMDDDHARQDTSLWTFHFFFVNKTMRRIVYFTCAEMIEEEAEIVEEEVDEDDSNGRTYKNTDVALVDDFDWDPSDNVAGGMSLEVSIE